MKLLNGQPVTLSTLAKQHDIANSTLYNRYNAGVRGKELVTASHRGRGNKQAATKLTKKDVIEIKTLLAVSELTQAEIAVKYCVHQCHISDIKRGKKWRDVIVDYAEIISDK